MEGFRSVLLIRSDELGWTEVQQIVPALPGVKLVTEVTHADAVVPAVQAHWPDVVISAAELDGLSLLPLLRQVRGLCPLSTLILAAMRFDPAVLPEWAALGVVGYLLWPEFPRSRLFYALTLLVSGQVMLASRSTLQPWLARWSEPGFGRLSLSARERAVLRGLAEGLTREQIAERYRLSRRTVDRVVTSLEAQLGTTSLFVLGVKATQLGLIA